LSTNSIVLAGGKGLRLGGEKALLEINGENLLQRVISNLGFLNSDIILVTAENQKLPQLAYNQRLKIVSDIYPRKGPLAGIYSGLRNSDSEKNFVIACDMPFLDREFISYLIEVSNGFDITIPRFGNIVEPLHSVYSKNCMESLQELLVSNSLKVDNLLKMVNVRYVETQEVNFFDPEHFSFININTKTDLIFARKLAKRVIAQMHRRESN
jgi:molybdopterin-guanine dinucleotide biosynthesis protein A